MDTSMKEVLFHLICLFPIEMLKIRHFTQSKNWITVLCKHTNKSYNSQVFQIN